MDELRRDILRLEAITRGMIGEYDNRYAKAHLKEINLAAQGMLVQLEYAALAHKGLD